MISIDLRDEHLVDNFKAINTLRQFTLLTDKEVQALYEQQVQHDRAEAEAKKGE